MTTLGAWMRRHLWQIGVALLAIGMWVAQVQGAVNDVAQQKAALPALARQLDQVKWSLDSLRLEITHMNRNMEELVRRAE